MATSYIYCIKIHNTSWVKIGTTKNPEKRMKQYESYLPMGFDIIGYRKNASYKMEAKLRKKLIDTGYAKTSNTEWLDTTLEKEEIIRILKLKKMDWKKSIFFYFFAWH